MKAQPLGEFESIDLVTLVALFLQWDLTRIADQNLSHVRLEQVVEPRHRRYTQNREAYENYLIARALSEHENQPDKLEAARSHFEQALKLYPVPP